MLHWGYDEHNGRGAAARSPPLGTGGLPSGRPRPSRGSAALPEPSRAAPCESCRQLEVPPGLRSDGAGGIWGRSDAGSIPCERGGGAGLEARPVLAPSPRGCRCLVRWGSRGLVFLLPGVFRTHTAPGHPTGDVPLPSRGGKHRGRSSECITAQQRGDRSLWILVISWFPSSSRPLKSPNGLISRHKGFSSGLHRKSCKRCSCVQTGSLFMQAEISKSASASWSQFGSHRWNNLCCLFYYTEK